MKRKLLKELQFWHLFSAIMLIGNMSLGLIIYAFSIRKYNPPIEFQFCLFLLMILNLIFAIPLGISNEALNIVDYSKLDD